jgi:hypothetical protein
VWSGAQEVVPFKFQTNSNGGSFSGFDLLSNTAVDNTVPLTYDAKFNYQNVSLPKSDLSLNKTEEQRADLLKRQIASDTLDLADKIGSQFYLDGTGNGGKNITGLGAIVDDGTSVATIGGQSRSTYSTLASTVTASGGTLTLAKMYTLWDAVSFANQKPDLILTTKTVRSLYNQLLTPNERYTMTMSAKDKIYMGTGAAELAFRSAPVVQDDKCTSGVMFMLNSESFKFKYLKNWEGATPVNYAVEEMDGVPSPEAPKGLGFFWTGWRSPVNQEVISGFVIHAGNFVAKNPRFNGKLTGITSI